MCPDTNSPEDSGKAYEKNHSPHFTDKNHDTGAPDLHICPLTRKCRAKCRAWQAGSLPAALRWFAEHHNWHEPAYLGNQLKLRLVFREPVLAATNKMLAGGRDGLAERVLEDFKRLRKMIKPLDNTGIRQIIDEDELEALEHTKATAVRRMNELADLIEIGLKNEECRIKNAETTQQTPEKGNQWLTNSEAGKILGIDRSTVSKWAEKGRFSDNGLEGQKKRLSKASVLLVKQEIEDTDRKKDDDTWHDEFRRYK